MTTTGGLKLTLINPAYMTRQVHEVGEKIYGIKGHITSLNLLNPGNAPDKWERKALKTFEKGSDEIYELTYESGKPVLKYMKALKTDKVCLKCHAAQGYHVGDLRGGISVHVRLDEAARDAYRAIAYLCLTHGLFLFTGIGGILIARKAIKKHLDSRVQAEKNLQSEKEKLTTTLQCIGDGVIVTDKYGLIIIFNEAAEKILGWSQEEAIGGHLYRVFRVTGKDGRIEENFLGKVLEGGFEIKTGSEATVVSRNGENRTIRYISSAIVSDDIEVVGSVTVFSDILERIAITEKLKDSEQRFRTLIDSVPFGLAILDNKNFFEYSNRKFLEIFGYSLEEIPSSDKWIEAIVSDEADKKKLLELLGVDRRTKVEYYSPEKKVFSVESKDGVEKTVRFTPVKLPVGKLILCCEDVTETKKLQEQLMHSQKMEAIGRLAGGVAHDFNNLLTTIRGFADLILFGLDEKDPVRQDVKEIKSSAERAAMLTRQLLAFSRKQILHPEIINLNDIVRDMDKMLRRMIGEDVELVTLTDPALGLVKVDRTQIQQVIMNLVINSRDAMPDGGTIVIETKSIEIGEVNQKNVKPGPYVKFSVRDTGCGIERELLDKIFDPFFTTKDVSKGTGLGLSIVYGIVEQSGGEINVESKPGEGTTFEIYLPCVEGEAGAKLDSDELSQSLMGYETILLVEDDPHVRNLTYRVLTQSGYDVLTAGYGDEALSMVKRMDGGIDLIVTDVVMPKMSGKELVKEVRKLYPDVKVLYVSGYANGVINGEDASEEIYHFIQKPFAIQSFLRKVRNILSEKGH